MESSSVKYIAELVGVREVALAGSSEIGWWREHLAGEAYEPVEVDGRAQIVVTGLDTKWKGMPFRDVSVIVAARRRDDPADGGFFLAQAFNVSRFIVFFERRWFHLPYRRRSDLSVSVGDTASIQLGRPSAPDLIAEMGSRPSSEPSPPRERLSQTLALFLPRGSERIERRWFMVRIGGLTSTMDFDADRDRFEVGGECANPVIAGLRASQFRPAQWHIRLDAAHARSKTMQVRR